MAKDPCGPGWVDCFKGRLLGLLAKKGQELRMQCSKMEELDVQTMYTVHPARITTYFLDYNSVCFPGSMLIFQGVIACSCA